MPKIIADDPVLEHVRAQWALFEKETAWSVSKKGNLWRLWEGKTVSIFRRRDGFFGWSYAEKNEPPRYSTGGYEVIEDAMSGLAEVLGVFD
jgi:hypothetical protein